MTPAVIPQRPTVMTFEEFLIWDDGSERRFELIDGIPMPLLEPNADHEDVADALCDSLKAHCLQFALPYVPKRLKQVRLNNAGELERSRKPDIVVFDQAEWQQMKGKSSSAAAYICPPMVIEVVSTNWQDDYARKVEEYALLRHFRILDRGLWGFGRTQIHWQSEAAHRDGLSVGGGRISSLPVSRDGSNQFSAVSKFDAHRRTGDAAELRSVLSAQLRSLH